jgi:hypothetical protein
MLLKKKDDGLRALRRAAPRSQAGFESLVQQHLGMRDAIVAGEPAPRRGAQREACATTTGPRTHRAVPGGGARPFKPTKRLVGLSVGAAIAVAAAVVAAIFLVGGGTPGLSPTPALAAEAVKKAALDTTAAAKSGIIETVLLIDDQAQVANRLSWNGDDVSLMFENDQQRQIRYVGGLYYETYGYAEPVALGDTSHEGDWFHVTSYDNGGSLVPEGAEGVSPNEQTAPALWLTATRTDLAGEGLVTFVTCAQGFTRTANDDGSVAYCATTSVAAIQSADWSLAGLPAASRPSFKVQDTSTPVTIKITVGTSGLIRELRLDWKLDIPGEARDWSYTSTYSELGTAPAITAPEPSHTVTTDSTFPKTKPGKM